MAWTVDLSRAVSFLATQEALRDERSICDHLTNPVVVRSANLACHLEVLLSGCRATRQLRSLTLKLFAAREPSDLCRLAGAAGLSG